MKKKAAQINAVVEIFTTSERDREMEIEGTTTKKKFIKKTIILWKIIQGYCDLTSDEWEWDRERDPNFT